jgi:hypothetical protein
MIGCSKQEESPDERASEHVGEGIETVDSYTSEKVGGMGRATEEAGEDKQ